MVRRIVHPIRTFLRVNFIAGLFVALPVGVTVVSLIWVWDLIDGPLRKVFGYGEIKGSPWEASWKAIKADKFEQLVVPLVGLFLLIVAVLLLGLLIRSFVGRALLNFFESIVARTPLVGVLYTSVKQLAEAFISSEGKAKFKSAVLVQFPMKGSWVIGFLTGSASEQLTITMSAPLEEDAAARGQPRPDIVTVFVPTTPLPSQGFTLVLPRSETRELPISVPDAIKLVISGGIITRKTSGLPLPIGEQDVPELPSVEDTSNEKTASSETVKKSD